MLACWTSWTRCVPHSAPKAAAAVPTRPAALHAAPSQVPVFAILLKEEGKLYGGPMDDQGVQPAMVYTQLEDAQRVIGQLTETYAETALELQPLALGAVLRQSGVLAPTHLARSRGC